MGIELLSKEILEDAKEKAKEIHREALSEKKKILLEAEKQKQEILSKAEKTVENIIAVEKREKISSAQLEAKRMINESKELAVNKALEELWQEFIKTRESKKYSESLSKLASQGVKEIGKDAIIKVNSKDLKLLKENFNLSKTSANISGGVIVCSADERIIVNNSFEALFDAKKDEMKKILFKELF